MRCTYSYAMNRYVVTRGTKTIWIGSVTFPWFSPHPIWYPVGWRA